ncbi:uncharacterized protein B0H18DRAFT_353025 [Fomitopsis serialis]|uniref:uncharacterized protein n=1 Tax=Fomitopsis serialis TaxID=139415 RepID=UPI0020089210|nr:uncharacterized protein B0H18DRAFT_353025 [Neoantrodia serialis]KAH9926189.1 hypothetical protein B0H18DRAFT_353025 [Neoantrodia serialis]
MDVAERVEDVRGRAGDTWGRRGVYALFVRTAKRSGSCAWLRNSSVFKSQPTGHVCSHPRWPGTKRLHIADAHASPGNSATCGDRWQGSAADVTARRTPVDAPSSACAESRAHCPSRIAEIGSVSGHRGSRRAAGHTGTPGSRDMHPVPGQHSVDAATASFVLKASHRTLLAACKYLVLHSNYAIPLSRLHPTPAVLSTA